MLKPGMYLQGRYEIIEKIGSGGMADVYKAKDHKLNRFVAMKVLKPEFSADTNFIRKFQREAQAAAGLAHPNVVNVFDVGEDQGANYIIMELVEGITLKEYISRKGKLTVKEATSIAIQVSMGLEAAHNRNIVHRDIKPQNIIISTDGKVKVTDFGIARVASSNTISTNAMGSVHYSSPEQVRGGYSDYKSDIYSLGITMYEMVTGRVPFDGDTTVAIAIKHLQDEMVPPSQYAPELPHSLEEIIIKCTQKSPDRRYNTLAELINDLKHSLIEPNGNFVNLSPLSNHAQTIVITPEEMKEIQGSTGRDSYTEPVKPLYTEPEDDDDDDDDDEDDYDEEYESRSRRKHRRYEEEEDDDDDEEDDKGGNTTVEKVMTIAGLVIGGIIICILIYFVASAAGLIGSGGNNSNETQTEGTADTEEDLVAVPDLSNMTEDQVKDSLKSFNLGYQKGGEEASDTVEAGKVVRQDPGMDTQVEKNSVVTVYFSSGPAAADTPETSANVQIPAGLIGQPQNDVVSQLNTLGLSTNVQSTQSDTVEIGNVVSLSPGEGETVAAGTEVTVQVSVGAGKVTVPDVIGWPQADAESALTSAGLLVSVEQKADTSQTVDYGEVFDQGPVAGEEVEKGTTVVLYVRNQEMEQQEAQNGENSENSGTSETSASSGAWVTEDLPLEKPEAYQGGNVRLTLKQGGSEKVIMEGNPIDFDGAGYTTGDITGEAGQDTGTLVLSEMGEDGEYHDLYEYTLSFHAPESSSQE